MNQKLFRKFGMFAAVAGVLSVTACSGQAIASIRGLNTLDDLMLEDGAAAYEAPPQADASAAPAEAYVSRPSALSLGAGLPALDEELRPAGASAVAADSCTGQILGTREALEAQIEKSESAVRALREKISKVALPAMDQEISALRKGALVSWATERALLRGKLDKFERLAADRALIQASPAAEAPKAPLETMWIHQKDGPAYQVAFHMDGNNTTVSVVSVEGENQELASVVASKAPKAPKATSRWKTARELEKEARRLLEILPRPRVADDATGDTRALKETRKAAVAAVRELTSLTNHYYCSAERRKESKRAFESLFHKAAADAVREHYGQAGEIEAESPSLSLEVPELKIDPAAISGYASAEGKRVWLPSDEEIDCSPSLLQQPGSVAPCRVQRAGAARID